MAKRGPPFKYDNDEDRKNALRKQRNEYYYRNHERIKEQCRKRSLARRQEIKAAKLSAV